MIYCFRQYCVWLTGYTLGWLRNVEERKNNTATHPDKSKVQAKINERNTFDSTEWQKTPIMIHDVRRKVSDSVIIRITKQR